MKMMLVGGGCVRGQLSGVWGGCVEGGLLAFVCCEFL